MAEDVSPLAVDHEALVDVLAANEAVQVAFIERWHPPDGGVSVLDAAEFITMLSGADRE